MFKNSFQCYAYYIDCELTPGWEHGLCLTQVSDFEWAWVEDLVKRELIAGEYLLESWMMSDVSRELGYCPIHGANLLVRSKEEARRLIDLVNGMQRHRTVEGWFRGDDPSFIDITTMLKGFNHVVVRGTGTEAAISVEPDCPAAVLVRMFQLPD